MHLLKNRQKIQIHLEVDRTSLMSSQIFTSNSLQTISIWIDAWIFQCLHFISFVTWWQNKRTSLSTRRWINENCWHPFLSGSTNYISKGYCNLLKYISIDKKYRELIYHPKMFRINSKKFHYQLLRMNEKYQNDIVAVNNRRTFNIRFIRFL